MKLIHQFTRSVIKSIIYGLLVLSFAGNAWAIVGGQPDCSPDPFGPPSSCQHSNVGFIADIDKASQTPFPLCSASLISLGSTAVVLTSGHCVVGGLGLNNNRIFVTFDSRGYITQAGYPYGSVPITMDFNRYIEVTSLAINPEYEQIKLAGKDNFSNTRSNDMALLFIDEENTQKLKQLWPDISPVHLPSLGLLDMLGNQAVKDSGLVDVGYGLDEIIAHGSSPQFTQHITTSGERRIGLINYLNATPEGWIRSNSTANNLDNYDSGSSGDSGSPIFYGNIQVGIHKGGLPSVFDIGPRIDTAKALDFICTYVPDVYPCNSK